MQITDTRVETKGNFKSDETHKMTFDPKANGFLLNTLIKQYSNPYLAAFREYTSNARDAHLKAGQTRPVEVTLPTDLSPALIIEDFGVGLSREGLRGYGTFGSSDKRDSNEYIGGFGLGSKSGLAVSSEFTVQAVKDGKRNTVIVTRAEDGSPVMEFLPERDAEGAANGVKITIPTTERHKFIQAIEAGFFMGWKPGTILIDGVAPSGVNIYDEAQYKPVEGGLGWKLITPRQRNTGNSVIAVVGGVKYVLDYSQIERLNASLVQGYLSEIVINLENGEVEIHPSRETLIYDKRTRSYIAKRIDALIEVGAKQYQDEIDNAVSFREALVVRHKAINFGFDVPYTYKGKKIDTTPMGAKDRHADANVTIALVAAGGSSEYRTERHPALLRNVTHHNVVPTFQAKRAILVWGAERAVRQKNNHRLTHPEAGGTLIHARVLAAAANVSPSGYVYHFTSLRPKHLPRWYVGLFTDVIKAEDFQATVSEARREIARAARATYTAIAKANGVTHTEPVFRVLNYADRGWSTYRTVKLSDMDLTTKYLLLKNGESTLTDAIRSAITTRSGHDAYRRMDDLAAYLIRQAGYTILLANKNYKTDDYATHLPLLETDITKAIKTAADEITNRYTPIKRMALRDMAVGYGQTYSWAIRIPEVYLTKIKRAELVEWLRAMRTTPKNVHTEFLTTVRETAHETQIDVSTYRLDVNLPATPAADYPLLGELRSHNNWDAILDYINILDTARGI